MKKISYLLYLLVLILAFANVSSYASNCVLAIKKETVLTTTLVIPQVVVSGSNFDFCAELENESEDEIIHYTLPALIVHSVAYVRKVKAYVYLTKYKPFAVQPTAIPLYISTCNFRV